MNIYYITTEFEKDLIEQNFICIDSNKLYDNYQKMLSDNYFELTVRTLNCLRAEKIITLEDLINYSNDNFLTKIKNLGPKSLAEIFINLKNLGIKLNTNKISGIFKTYLIKSGYFN